MIVAIVALLSVILGLAAAILVALVVISSHTKHLAPKVANSHDTQIRVVKRSELQEAVSAAQKLSPYL